MDVVSVLSMSVMVMCNCIYWVSLERFKFIRCGESFSMWEGEGGFADYAYACGVVWW